MSKRILVTGGAGFIGSHFIEHILANTHWGIVGLDSFRHKGDSLRVLNSPRYQIYCTDLTAPISPRLKELIGDVDYIVNFASESHVDRSIKDPVPFCTNNTALMLNMLEYCRNVNPEKFIHVSTDEVYGPAKKDMAHKEWDVILPSNPYSASKAAQEAFGISYWRTYGVPLVIVNAMNLIGERQDKEKFLPLLISKINNNEEVPIHGSYDRISGRSYQHARNLCDAILHLLLVHKPTMYKDSDEIIMPSRYNVVGERYMNNVEFAGLIAKLLDKPLKYRFVDFHSVRPGHDLSYNLDGEKLRSMGWKQPKTLEESLEKTVKWYLAHPEWL